MNDKELIIKAAKTAGITGEWNEEDNVFLSLPFYSRWDPLVNADHALQLVVDLDLNVRHGWSISSTGLLAMVVVSNQEGTVSCGEVKQSNPRRAMLRAIVQVAAGMS